MERPHWEYYLTVVQDLDMVSRYIEFTQSNFATHSVELVRILLSVGSEIDVVAKVLCQQADAQATPGNISDYRTVLLQAYPSLPTVEVSMPKYSLALAPWLDWNQGTNPTWWRSYNNVKHERNTHYAEANLENALSATAALCILVCHLYHGFFESHVIKRPLLFLDNKHISDGPLLHGKRYRLPAFQT